VPWCVWGECDFHVNWLHVSRIRPTHWRLNDDFDINRRHRRLTQIMHIGVCCVSLYVETIFIFNNLITVNEIL